MIYLFFYTHPCDRIVLTNQFPIDESQTDVKLANLLIFLCAISKLLRHSVEQTLWMWSPKSVIFICSISQQNIQYSRRSFFFLVRIFFRSYRRHFFSIVWNRLIAKEHLHTRFNTTQELETDWVRHEILCACYTNESTHEETKKSNIYYMLKSKQQQQQQRRQSHQSDLQSVNWVFVQWM